MVGLVLHCGHNFEEGRHVLILDFTSSFEHGSLGIGSIARAASERGQSLWFRWLVFASWLLADKFALWSWAHQWLSALPVAVSSFAQRSALWLWGDAGSVADRRRADSLAFWAVILLAQVLWASDRASWLLAVNIAFRAREFLALHLALWSGADWVADSRARWIIALPLALWVALSSRLGCGSNNGH